MTRHYKKTDRFEIEKCLKDFEKDALGVDDVES